jgi:hypothetical protein
MSFDIGYYEIKVVDEGLSLGKSSNTSPQVVDDNINKSAKEINYLKKYMHTFIK